MSRNQIIRIETVRRLSLLSELNEQELSWTAEACQEKRFASGATIVEEGDRGHGLFVIHRGLAEVLKARGRRQAVIARLRVGDPIGEMSLVTDAPISASVRSAGAVSCLFIPRARFLSLIDEHPTIGRKVLWSFAQTLSKRLDSTNQRYARSLRRWNRRAWIQHLVRSAWVLWLMLFAYLWVWFRRKIHLPHRSEKLSRIHRRHARRFKAMATRLKGANIKAGQLASLQVQLLPKEYIDEFKSLRDEVAPTEYPLVAGLIQHEFGVGPLELFAEFDKTPLAAASMGQVHEARLFSGERVVVKVLHPGLEQSVAIDLWLLRVMIRVFRWFFRTVDLRQLYLEAEAPLRKELDLLHEAKATEELDEALTDIGVIVPKVFWKYTTRRVLTLEFIDGVKIDNLAQLDEWNIDRKALIQTYLQAFFRQAFEGGFFHCDPHPANVFCTREGQLALLDFGMVKRLPDAVRIGIVKEALGGFFNNPKLYADGLIERGVVDEVERDKLEEFAREMFDDASVRSAIFDHDFEDQGQVTQLFGKVDGLVKSLETFRTPHDQLMFMRALAIVVDVCKEVYSEESVSELTNPVVMPIFMAFMQENPQYVQHEG